MQTIVIFRTIKTELTDMQAAVGVAQLDKLDGFISARRDLARHLDEHKIGTRQLFGGRNVTGR
jgi:dTDP-4-amino-4,6-dideoxygalactose transaminase